MTELWCLHVLGPDDVHPAPSKEEAERAAAFMTKYYQDWMETRGEHPMDPHISFEAAPWPHSPESHAEDLKFFYVITGLSPPSTVSGNP